MLWSSKVSSGVSDISCAGVKAVLEGCPESLSTLSILEKKNHSVPDSTRKWAGHNGLAKEWTTNRSGGTTDQAKGPRMCKAGRNHHLYISRLISTEDLDTVTITSSIPSLTFGE